MVLFRFFIPDSGRYACAFNECNTISFLGPIVNNNDWSWRSYTCHITVHVSGESASSIQNHFSQIKLLNTYCCHLGRSPETQILDRVEKRAKNVTGKSPVTTGFFSRLKDVPSLSLFSRYHFGRCSCELIESVLNLKIFSTGMCRANPLT